MGSSTKASVLRAPLLAALSAALALPAAPLSAQSGENPWQFRLRATSVIPDEDATITPINGDVDIDVSYVPEFDITYFFTPNVAAELILATTEHDVEAIGTDAGDVDVGSVWLLPPTLLLQYHIAPDAPVRPYLGIGVNLTLFYSEDVPGTVVTDADYDSSVGFAFQAGFDIPFSEGSPWMINADAKKILINTDVGLNDDAIRADVDIDPWVVSIGLGYRPGA